MKKYLRLFLLTVACLPALSFAGCSTAQGTTKQGRSTSYVQIESRKYNTATRGFDRPWPFGPESDVQ